MTGPGLSIPLPPHFPPVAAGNGGLVTYEAREEGESEPDVEGVKRLADVLGAYGKLG